MRSSISNSDPSRPWPKSHPVVLAILLALTWVATTTLLNGLDPYPKPRRAAREGSAALGPRTRLLVVGTSHVLDGIRPSLLGPHAMNLALGGGDYRAILLVLQHRLADMPNLERVVLEADNLACFKPGWIEKTFRSFMPGGFRGTISPCRGAPSGGKPSWNSPGLRRSFFPSAFPPERGRAFRKSN